MGGGGVGGGDTVYKKMSRQYIIDCLADIGIEEACTMLLGNRSNVNGAYAH